MKVKIKRVYEPVSKDDGYRILVDRHWPRGVKKSEAKIDLWAKDIAPSEELRKWFGHDPKKWNEFKAKYYSELDNNLRAIDRILKLDKDKSVTLIYSARYEEHNQAVVLKQFLEDYFLKNK